MTWIQEHFPVSDERLGETAMPSIALPAQHAQTFRCLGPCDRIGDEIDARGGLRLVAVAAKPDHQLHVFTDCVVKIAACSDDGVAAEEAERAGDDEVPAEPVPGQAPKQKCPQVLDCLKAGQRIARHAHLDHSAVGDLRPVRDADRAAGCQDVVGADERPHQTPQRVPLDDRVRVDGADEISVRQIEPGVQRIRLPAILLVDDDQVRIGRRTVEADDVRVLHAAQVDRIGRREGEGVGHRREGAVAPAPALRQP